jgi:hypothetical protein
VCAIPVVTVHREQPRLGDDVEYGRLEVVREGFAEVAPRDFAEMLAAAHGQVESSSLTRLALHSVPCLGRSSSKQILYIRRHLVDRA